MILNRAMRDIVAIALIVAALIAIGAVAATPFAQLSGFDAELAEKKAELARLRNQTAEEATLRTENESLIASGQSTSLLLDGDTTGIAGANLQKLINDLVLAHGGTASSLQVLPPTDEKDLVRIALSLSISVAIDGLHGFLYDLETRQPLIFINDIRIRSSQDGLGQPDPHYLGPLDVTLQVSAFAAKKEQAQ